jgi:hypothetical protein
MDGNRFDDLVRELGGPKSRRSALGVLAGSVVALLGGAGADAASKRALGEICRKNGDCASGLCGPKDRYGRQSCACATDADCNDGNACTSDHCDPTTHTCSHTFGCVTGVANASAVCTAKSCGFACNSGFKECAGACILEGDCCTGADCTTDVADASATCVAGICGFACNGGFMECTPGLCMEAECCTHADCDDGDGCTLDLCGPVSHTCLQTRIRPFYSDTCVSCSVKSDCLDGDCCGGRCCTDGGTCSTNDQGIPVCCTDCHGKSAKCCDEISVTTTDSEVLYSAEAAYCLEGTGTCAGCTACGTFNCSFSNVDNVDSNAICGVDYICPFGCVAPVGRWA